MAREGESEFIPAGAYVLPNGITAPICQFYPRDRYQQIASLVQLHNLKDFAPAQALATSPAWGELEFIPAFRLWAKSAVLGGVQQFSGGMLTPKIGVAVDQGYLQQDSRHLALLPMIGELALPSLPTEEFYNPDPGGYTRPDILHLPPFSYAESFPNLWKGLPPKMSNSLMELRFMALDSQTSEYPFLQ